MCLNLSTLILVAVARTRSELKRNTQTHTHTVFTHPAIIYSDIPIYSMRLLTLLQMVYATLDEQISHAVSFMEIFLIVKKLQCNTT